MVNAVIWFPVRLQASKGTDSRGTVVAHAVELRKGMEKLKDLKFIGDLVAGVAKIQSQVAWDKRGQDMANVNERCLVVNVTTR